MTPQQYNVPWRHTEKEAKQARRQQTKYLDRIFHSLAVWCVAKCRNGRVRTTHDDVMIEGGSLFRTLQRSQNEGEQKVNDMADKLEASRRKNAEATALARVELALQKDRKDAAAAVAAAQQAALARLKHRREHAGASRHGDEVLKSLTLARDARAACAWYYCDLAGKKQGPFSPQQMRQWFQSGHLPRELRVAPAFADGRVPLQSDMKRIDELFSDPLSLTAFRSVQLGEEKPPPRKRAREPPKPTGNWLQDSINRQKAGIHYKRHDSHSGPGMLFESHEA